MNDNELLNERLANDEPVFKTGLGNAHNEATQPAPSSPKQDLDLCQWQVGPNGMFRPAARTVAGVPSGAYSVLVDDFGPYLRSQPMMSDEIIELPESANITVLSAIRKFWGSRERYVKHGLVFKRGILLWGPPGSGKSITCQLLVRDIISRDGVVVFCGNPDSTAFIISAIRRIEPHRPLIVVYEDIDEIVNKFGEHTILSMLDGEQQTDNVVSVATTNYPERLGARIVNRPSRFDERIFVGMPSFAARVAYLKKATGGMLDLAKWAKDTEGLSIAHLRELVAAVICLDHDYSDVLSRLRLMNERPKDVDGYQKRAAGFGIAVSNQQQTASGGL